MISDQWATIVYFFRGVVALLASVKMLKANFEVGLAFRSCSQLTLWWRRCREDLGV